MKKILIAALFASATITSCKKTETVTPVSTVAAYTVDGIHDVILTEYYNSAGYAVNMPLTVTYHDSAQQKVTVSVSEVPNVFIGTYHYSSGVTALSTGPWTGYPTFSIPLALYFKGTMSSYKEGTYPATITVTSGSSTKKYDFNVILK